MVTADLLVDKRREQTRAAAVAAGGYLRVGVWSAGWLLARTLTLLFATVAGVFFGIGWCCARVVPVLRFVRTAFMLGWEAGRARGSA